MSGYLRPGPTMRAQHESNLFVLQDHLNRAAILTGKVGGQTLYGGFQSGEALELLSTSHATKGLIKIGNTLTVVETDQNLGFGGDSFFGGKRVIFLRNRDTAPTSNPSQGGVLYAQAGALMWRGPTTTTTVAPA